MPSQYNKDQRKQRLFNAIKMRDEVIERKNPKTGEIEKSRYSRKHIKDINGLTAYEAIHLGIYPKPKTNKELLGQGDGKLQRKLTKQIKADKKKLTTRRIKEQ